MAKVLIVDDNSFFRRLLCEKFSEETEFQVCGEAENGKEAVEKALKLHPDIILIDLVMPVMNGLDAARVLRLLMPGVPLILSSAFADELVEHQARLVGIPEIAPKSAHSLVERARRAVYPPAQAAA